MPRFLSFHMVGWMKAFSKQHEKQTRAKLYDPSIQFKKIYIIMEIRKELETPRILNQIKKNMLVYLTRVTRFYLITEAKNKVFTVTHACFVAADTAKQ